MAGARDLADKARIISADMTGNEESRLETEARKMVKYMACFFGNGTYRISNNASIFNQRRTEIVNVNAERVQNRCSRAVRRCHRRHLTGAGAVT